MNNFKSIKNAVYRFTINEKVDGKHSPLLNIFTKELKKSPVLKEQQTIENELPRIGNDEKRRFGLLSEMLNHFNTHTKDEVLKANTDLYNKLVSSLNEEDKSKFDKLVNENKFTFDELILVSCKDTKDFVAKYDVFEKYLNESKNDGVSDGVNEGVNPKDLNKKVLSIAINKFNEKYSFLNENEKNILNAFLYNDKNNIQNIFDSLIKENSNLVKRRLSELDESEETLKEKLNKTLSKLNEMKKSDVNIDLIMKLNELRTNI